MSVIAYFGPATVTSTAPLTVTMPRAASAQPATNLGGPISGIGATVIVTVREDGGTFVHGTPSPSSAAAQTVLVPGEDGSVWRIYADATGLLKTMKVS